MSTKIRNIVLGIVLRNKDIKMTNIKVGIDAFNDLAKSHDAHAKEVERLQKELEQIKAENIHKEEEPEDIFRRKPKKKKRVATEKQKAHLKRMREKKAEKKRVKKLEQEKEKEERNYKINEKK